MVNKQKKDNFLLYILYTFLSLILLGFITIIIIHPSDKPTYLVYQIQCHNESSAQYYNYPTDFHTVNCSNFIIEIPCYDSKGNTIIGLTCTDNSIFCIETNDGDYKGYYKGYTMVLQNSESAVMRKKNIFKEVCETVKVNMNDYKHFTMDDCFDKFSDGNSSTESDTYRNYMICANILSPYLHKAIVAMSDGKEYTDGKLILDIDKKANVVGFELDGFLDQIRKHDKKMKVIFSRRKTTSRRIK